MPFTTNVQYNELPPWMRKPVQETVAEAVAETKIPYRRYGEERVEPATPDVLRAHELGRAHIGEHRGHFNEARRALGRGTSPFHAHAQEYMNPYQRHVVSQIAEEGNRNFEENVLPALEARFVRLGQHGGSRHGRMARNAARDLQHEILNRQQQAMAQGYQQAGQMYNADMARQLDAARSMADIGTMGQAANFADVAALENQGRYQQQQGQAQRDIMYQEWLRNLEHPIHRLSQRQAILQGLPVPTLNQAYFQTPTTPQMNTWGQVGPMAGQILGAMMGRR